MDPIVHFEIPVKDLAKSKTFYQSIFGWEVMDHAMPNGQTYVGCVTTAVDEKTRIPHKPGAINGGMMLQNANIKVPVFAIHVASIDEKVKKIEAAGGKVVQPKMDLGIGFYSYIADPEGTIVGLWEDAKK